MSRQQSTNELKIEILLSFLGTKSEKIFMNTV